MASKKYTLLLALLGLMQTATFAQSNGNNANADWAMDSSKVSTKKMPQHNEFMNNQYPYPSKPRNQWELGFGAGASFILGDVEPRLGYGGSVSLRKALGHVVSLRAGYAGTIASGINIRPVGSYYIPTQYPNPWQAYTAAGKTFVPNYKTKMHQLSLDAIISLNPINYYRGNPKANWYVLAGYTLYAADVDVNALNGNALYDYSGVDFSGSTTDIQKQIKDMMDDSYESNAPVTHGGREGLGRYKDNWLIRNGFNFGGGVAFKLSDRVNIGIEQRFTALIDDEIDGLRGGDSKDILSSTQVRLNLNIGNKNKTIQPLWWINPNNFAYNEINTPKHMKIPTPVLPDADGDGVTDQFDQEPNTPAGAAVDSHGVAKDTDGDGVPDYKDKELLTAQNCFPVNADGVGNCPEPACCTELRSRLDSMKTTCAITGLPSVQFKAGSVKLASAATASLSSAAQQINANPNCKVKVVGYGASDKRAQQLSWDRVNAVIKYLVEKQGISESRFIFTYGQEGDANTVDLEGTTEEGPNTVPAPHPNLKKTR